MIKKFPRGVHDCGVKPRGRGEPEEAWGEASKVHDDEDVPSCRAGEGGAEVQQGGGAWAVGWRGHRKFSGGRVEDQSAL